MKTNLFVILLMLLSARKAPADQPWKSEKQKGYTLFFTESDVSNKNDYLQLLQSGITATETFFQKRFPAEFNVFVHPDRQSMETQWRKDWNMPDFKSECWMVASGTGFKLDMISPKKWDYEACEHRYADAEKTQQLITHELVHVFHGLHNVSRDFSETQGIDWFVEGLATYASGQLTQDRINQLKQAQAENKLPANLENFWTGKLKYAVSGSVVKYLDEHYGRSQILKLMRFTKVDALLQELNLTEEELIQEWHTFISKQ